MSLKIDKNLKKRVIILLIVALTLFSCSENKKKEVLWKAFCEFQMRDVPMTIARFDKLHEFDIVCQNESTISYRYNYPNTYVLGLYDDNSKSYKRIHTIEGFVPKDNYHLIKVTSNFYSTDTTYLDNIQYTDTINIESKKNIPLLKDTLYCISKDQYKASYKMKNKSYVVLIYRRTNPTKRNKATGEFMMWKRETIQLAAGKIKAELIEQMNKHTF